MTYPILVERYKKDQAMTIVCERCEAEEVIFAEDLVNGNLYACPRWAEGCEGSAVHKYEEADCCPGCGELGFLEEALKFSCSRRCMLQAEYAKTLETS